MMYFFKPTPQDFAPFRGSTCGDGVHLLSGSRQICSSPKRLVLTDDALFALVHDQASLFPGYILQPPCEESRRLLRKTKMEEAMSKIAKEQRDLAISIAAQKRKRESPPSLEAVAHIDLHKLHRVITPAGCVQRTLGVRGRPRSPYASQDLFDLDMDAPPAALTVKNTAGPIVVDTADSKLTKEALSRAKTGRSVQFGPLKSILRRSKHLSGAEEPMPGPKAGVVDNGGRPSSAVGVGEVSTVLADSYALNLPGNSSFGLLTACENAIRHRKFSFEEAAREKAVVNQGAAEQVNAGKKIVAFKEANVSNDAHIGEEEDADWEILKIEAFDNDWLLVDPN